MGNSKDTCVYLSFGGNLNPEKHIAAAIQELMSVLRFESISPFYRTEAIGRPEQPSYLNGVARAWTGLEAESLKRDVLRPLEAKLGRRRSADTYAARCIDLDILLYDELVCKNEAITLPDPDIVKRPFLSAGLLMLAPELVLPGDTCPLRSRVDLKSHTTLEIDTAFSLSMKELLEQ